MMLYDRGLERAVLQTILFHFPSLVKLSTKHLLSAEHFADLSHKRIFLALKKVFDSGVRKPSRKLIQRKLERLKSKKNREKALIVFERLKAPNEESIHNVDAFVDELDTLYQGRKLQYLVKDIASSLGDGDIANALSAVQKINDVPDTGIPVEDSDFLDIFGDTIELDKQKKAYPELFRRFPTGIIGVNPISGEDVNVDKNILNGGLMRATITLIGGDTGLGKTQTLNWIFRNTIKQRASGLFVTNEMSLQHAQQQVVSGLTGIDFNRIEKGELVEKDYARIRNREKFYKKIKAQAKVVSYPEVSTVGVLRAKMIEYRQEGFNPDVVVLDYLNEMSEDGGNGDSRGDWAGIGRVASDLRGLCLSWDSGIELDNGFRIYGVPIVTATQKKTSAAGKSMARTEDVAYSPVPGQVSSAVAHLVQDSDMKEMDVVDLVFTKCRFGKLGRVRMYPDFAKSRLHSKRRVKEMMMDNSYDLGDDDG